MHIYNFFRFKKDIFFIDSHKKIKNHDFFIINDNFFFYII